ncbi:WhiB family transcriptional regulator [Streptomyces sp. NPDC058914]|uniref:WhiB family transcriptional regulator n=1 Tax=Streptomyces sp. NPDC058914 TaxID=3346671 RepID=UPI003687FA90
MAQTTTATVRPPAIALADPAVPYPQMTGAEPCRQTDPEEWFPEHGHNATAVRLCGSCPLAADCRKWALANPTLASDGIWGGLTRAQRHALLRSNLRTAA